MRFLRGLLPLAALVTLLALTAAVALLLVARAAEPLRTAAENDRQAAAGSVAAGMRVWFETARGQATAVAAALPTDTSDPLPLQERLRELAPGAALFDAGIFVVDPDGRILAAGVQQQGYVGRVGTPPPPAALGGRATVTSVVRDAEQGLLVVAAAAPVVDPDGRVVAVVVGETTVGAVTAVLRAAVGTPALAITLLGPDDQVLHPDGNRPQHLAADAGFPSAENRSAPQLARYRGEGGVDTLAGLAPVSDGWTAVVAGAEDDVAAATRLPLAAAVPGVVALVVLALVGFVLLERRARREARLAKESRTALLAVVGHELRTPLTVILGYAQMLGGRWARIPDAKKQEIVKTIGRQSRTLDRLIERLLYAGQLGRGGITKNLVPRDVDLATLLDGVVELFAPESPLHEFEVSTERPLQAYVDPEATSRILGHLVENAVKYSPAGGRIRISATRTGKRVRLVVDDEGVGLPADMSCIFEEFSQAQDVDTRVQDEGGIGLGLHIVRTLVVAMGGRVSAERLEPNGARFVVSLPAGNGERASSKMVTSNHVL